MDVDFSWVASARVVVGILFVSPLAGCGHGGMW